MILVCALQNHGKNVCVIYIVRVKSDTCETVTKRLSQKWCEFESIFFTLLFNNVNCQTVFCWWIDGLIDYLQFHAYNSSIDAVLHFSHIEFAFNLHTFEYKYLMLF